MRSPPTDYGPGIEFPGEAQSPAGQLDEATRELISRITARLERGGTKGDLEGVEKGSGRRTKPMSSQQRGPGGVLGTLCAVPLVADALRGTVDCEGAAGMQVIVET